MTRIARQKFCHSELADLRTYETKWNSDSEQIEHTVAKPQMRNFVSVEQIQDDSES